MIQFCPSNQHHVCLGINICLGLPEHCPLERGGSCGEELIQAVLYERWPFPLGLIKRQFLVTPGTGGSLKQARSCLLPPCPAEFRSCAYQCDLNEAALQGKLGGLVASAWSCSKVAAIEGCRALKCECLFFL